MATATKEKPQRATLPREQVDNAYNYSGKKELVDTYNLVAYKRSNGLRELITCRCWMGRSNSASVVHAAIWVHGGGELYFSGRGSAGGYGYHKQSAAIDDAIESAGIKLEHSIHGVGDGAIHEALTAIARAMGYHQTLIVVN